METNAFTIIKGRYIVLLWLLPFIYMPGTEFLIHRFLDSTDEWYWFDIVYYYYYHAIILTGLLILLYSGKPDWRIMFGKLQQSELAPAVKLTAFIFVFSMATAYLLFYPLSFIAPEFVEYWYIDVPGFIYADANNGTYSYPVIANFLSFSSMVIIAPVLEEFLFRGLLLHRWNKKWNLKYAILLSSLLFGIVHPDPVGATAFGIAMCVLYLRTQSLWVPIFCHAINNLVVWLLEAGWVAYYGPDHTYTLEDFQNDWPWGLFWIFITIAWIFHYMSKPRTYRKWYLPDA